MSHGYADGHDLNADQIAYWNGPAGQRWTERQQAQDILLAPVAEILIDRAEPEAGERIIDVGCGCGATTIALAQKVGADRAMCWASTFGPMLARARQARQRTCRSIRAGGRHGLSLRARKLRSAGLAVRRDVLRRSGAFVCQYAQSVAAVGAAGVRLLARAARKPLDDGAAAGGLPARAEAAAAGPRRSRAVRVCLGGARAPDPGRGRLYRIAMEACPLSLDVAIGQGSTRRWKARWRSARPPRTGRTTAGGARRRDQLDPRGAGAIRQRRHGAAAGSIWIVTARLRERSVVTVRGGPFYLCMGLFSRFFVPRTCPGPLLADHRQMHDGLHGLFHVLPLTHSSREWKACSPAKMLGQGSPMNDSREPSVPPRMESSPA